jgi:DNA-binding transcriptional ArsR family regulator
VVARGKDGVFRRQAQVLKALANESRLKLVDRLSRGECSVGELTTLIGSDHSTVSKHLAVLRAHGIVHDVRRRLHLLRHAHRRADPRGADRVGHGPGSDARALACRNGMVAAQQAAHPQRDGHHRRPWLMSVW